MIAQVQLAFLLAAVALVRNDALTDEGSSPVNMKVIYSAKLDKSFDAILPHLRSFILQNGMDPMELKDISDSLLPALPGIFKGSIDLKNGWLQEMSKLKRNKHITAIYSNKCLVLDMDLGYDLLDFNYDYHLKYLLYERDGDLYGRLYKLEVKVVVTIDLANYYVILNSIKFQKVGEYDIKFEGNLLDPILNIVTKVVTTIFEDQILDFIESRAFEIFNEKINELNKMFPRPNRTQLIGEWLYGNKLNIQLS